MKIILTHAYFLNDDPREQLVMKPYPPLGIMYLASWLEKNHIHNEVFDSTFSSFEEWCKHISEKHPDVLGIYVNLMTKTKVLEMIKYIRREEKLKKCKIVLGGPEVRNSADLFLQYGADIIIVGEGEQTFYELIINLHKPQPILEKIKGIVFKKNTDIIHTGERDKLKSLDLIPPPARHKINLEKYLKVWKETHGYSTVSVSTMRGCPYTCKWCSRAVYGLSYRRRNAKDVVEELKMIMKTYNPDRIWFVDDVFTISQKWLAEFDAALETSEVKISYECITRADRMNEDVIRLLKKSGCFRVWIGAESGSQSVIDAMDRRVQIAQVKDMIQLTRAYGLEAGTFIMLGYPGETEKDIKNTVKHLTESNPDQYTITLTYPIKGTPLYEEVKDKIISAYTWSLNSDREIDFKRTYTRRYYDYAIRYLHNQVEFHRNRKLKNKLNSIIAFAGMWYERAWSGKRNNSEF